MYQYVPALADAGIRVTPAPLLAGDDLSRRQATGRYPWPRLWAAIRARLAAVATRRRYDVLWISTELMPFLPALLEHLLLRGGPPCVVEYDDAVFHRYDRHRSALVRALLGAKIDRLMRGAGVVVAGNAYLADRARTAGARDVAIIPSVVELDRYPVAPPRAGGPVVIGWIDRRRRRRRSTRSRPRSPASAPAGRARVVLVGVTPRRRAWPFPCEERPWVEGGEAADISGFDIGIMPLADDPMVARQVRLQAGAGTLACARPAVASPIGVNPEIVIDGNDRAARLDRGRVGRGPRPPHRRCRAAGTSRRGRTGARRGALRAAADRAAGRRGAAPGGARGGVVCGLNGVWRTGGGADGGAVAAMARRSRTAARTTPAIASTRRRASRSASAGWRSSICRRPGTSRCARRTARCVVVFNGEIYNYRDAARLSSSARASPFRGGSDTEVLVDASRPGASARRCRSCGACSRSRCGTAASAAPWLVRDRLGKKPLYYGRAPTARCSSAPS